MKTVQKRLSLPKNEYYAKHLSIMNVFLPVKMTPKEIETLANFMSLDGDIANDRFGSSARKIVMNQMEIKPGGLGNYLKTLQEKKFIIKDPIKKFVIWGALYPDPEVQNYQFQLLKNE
jgi:hypothetical protein